MELKPSKILPGEVGVFAVRNIKKGTKIAEGPRRKSFERNVVPWHKLSQYDRETQKKIKDFCIGTPTGFLKFPCLDFNELTVSWYFNHSCDGNIGFNKAGDFIATRNIKKGEEMTYDYGLLETNPKFLIKKCGCKSKNCRKRITGSDWKSSNLRAKIDYMHPYLRGKLR